jgi:hypothetical protein
MLMRGILRVYCIHTLNGHLMVIMMNDDPTSSNNCSRNIGIEVEATTKVSAIEIWIKKAELIF